MIEELFHSLRHEFLHRIRLMQRVELLSPQINLRTGIDLSRAYIVARQSERASADVVGIAWRIVQQAEIDADGTGDEVSV